MKKNLCLLVASCISAIAIAQFDRSSRFFVGFKGGINFTHPIVIESYSVFEPTPNSNNGDTPKEYTPFFSNLGFQGGLVLTYAFNNFLSLTMQPMYFQYKYGYENTYNWTDTTANRPVQQIQQQTYTLHYLELPIMLKFEFIPGRVTPYAQVGIYGGHLFNAGQITASQNAYGATIPAGTPLPTSGINNVTANFNPWNVGAIGGVGVNYYTNAVTIGLEANVRYGFLPLVSARNRYDDSGGTISEFFDAPDKLQLLNMAISLVLTFPVGYAENGKGSSRPYCTFQQ